MHLVDSFNLYQVVCLVCHGESYNWGILALFSNTIYSESGKVNNLLMFLPKDYVSMQN